MTKELKLWQFNLIYSLLTIAIYNPNLSEVAQNINPSWTFTAAIYLLAFAALNIILSILFCTPKISKTIGIILLLCNSIALYFMNTYHVLIDRIMILNIMHTNIYETKDLLHWKLFAYLILLGILPAYIIGKIKIRQENIRQEIKIRLFTILGSLLIAGAIILPNQAASKQIYKGHKELR